MSSKRKVLMISHGHPDYNKGGGEIAAYNLHCAINAGDEFQSVFMARHDQKSLVHGGTAFAGTGRPGEILFHSSMPDWFYFSQPDKARIWRDFRELLEVTQPDIVHFHHYIHLGLELFREVKSFNPDTQIVLTLHEYFAICHNHGQMIKPRSNALCHESSPSACAQCFPDKSAQDFMLREQFIKSHLDMVDAFVSPSEFLKNRYVRWGLPENRFRLIENLLTSDSKPAPSPAAILPRISLDMRKVRLAFFGQINSFKGVEVLLEAIGMLPEDTQQQIQVDINGSGLDKQSKALQNSVSEHLKALKDVVRMRGPYAQSELISLMAGTDWAIMPSTWWENSPVVILEARQHGVPVICSDIGGMAEKIVHGRTGLQFQARRADSLADQIQWAVTNRSQQPEFSARIKQSHEPEKPLTQHLNLYRQLPVQNLSEHSQALEHSTARAA